VLFFSEEALATARPKLAERGYTLAVRANRAATREELASCEDELGVTLSPDVRAFLESSNGAMLEQHHKDEVHPAQGTYLTFLKSEEIVERTLDMRNTASDLGVTGIEALICIVDYLDGNYVLLDTRKSEGPIVDGYHEEMRSWLSAPPIARSFAEFTEKVIDALHRGKGMLYWLPGEGTA